MDDKTNNPLTPSKWRFEFGLRSLFYATALVATGLALTPSSIWISLAVLLFWGIVFLFLSAKKYTCLEPVWIAGFWIGDTCVITFSPKGQGGKSPSYLLEQL